MPVSFQTSHVPVSLQTGRVSVLLPEMNFTCCLKSSHVPDFYLTSHVPVSLQILSIRSFGLWVSHGFNHACELCVLYHQKCSPRGAFDLKGCALKLECKVASKATCLVLFQELTWRMLSNKNEMSQENGHIRLPTLFDIRVCCFFECFRILSWLHNFHKRGLSPVVVLLQIIWCRDWLLTQFCLGWGKLACKNGPRTFADIFLWQETRTLLQTHSCNRKDVHFCNQEKKNFFALLHRFLRISWDPGLVLLKVW